MDSRKMGHSARWGGACAPCAAARTRCIRPQSSVLQPCDRCRSLETDCESQTSRPRKKRKPKSSASNSTRTALPEAGPNGLTFSSSTPGKDSSAANGSLSSGSLYHLANNHSASSISSSPQARGTPSQLETAPRTPAHDFTPGAPAGSTCTCMAPIDVDKLVPVESDESLLSIYRNRLSGPFPFVIVPAGTTPRQMEAGRPFLMKVIRMVASIRHLRSVREQSRAVMQHISDAMLMRSERSLDLLQGILVFLGSYHYHCMAHAQFNNLIRLAVSLVEDLGLSTCLNSQQRRNQPPFVRAEKPASRTNEEKRALLGVWYVSSNASLVVEQVAVTRYSKYMDQYLRDLDEAAEYKMDQFVIQLVRIQRLTERILKFHGSDPPMDDPRASPGPPLMAQLEAFRVELDSLRNALPLNLKSDYLLSCYHSRAYLLIFAPLLAGSHLPDTESQSFASLQLSGVPMADVFSHFTAALKAWLGTWLNVPVCSYFYMSQPAYTQLVHGAMMLTQWVRVAGPSAVRSSNARSAMGPWRPPPALSGVLPCPDLSLPKPSPSAQVESVRILNTFRAKVAAQPHLQIDVLGVLDTMAARFEAAKNEMAAAQGLYWENDTWDVAAEHLRTKKARIERWCEMVVAMAEGRGSPPTDRPDSARDGTREGVNTLSEWNVDEFQRVMAGYDWDDLQWESFMFDELLQDIHN